MSILEEGPIRKFLKEREPLVPRKKLVDLLTHSEETWRVKAKEHYWGREHWEKRMIEPIGGRLIEYKRGEYVIFEAPAYWIEDYIRRRILIDYEILSKGGVEE